MDRGSNEFCYIEDLPSAMDKKEEAAAESNEEAAKRGEDTQAQSIADGTEGTQAVMDE